MLDFEKKVEKLKAQQKEFRDQLYQKMEENDIKKIDTGDLIITRVLPTVRKSVDSTKLKKEMPDVYTLYLKESTVKGSIRIKERKEVSQ
jgi:regulator of replication initiation timing